MPPPQTPPLVGRGHPLPTPNPLGAFGASILVPISLRRSTHSRHAPFYPYRYFFFSTSSPEKNFQFQFKHSWNNAGIVRLCDGKEPSILWSHHEKTRELPGKSDYARNNVW